MKSFSTLRTTSTAEARVKKASPHYLYKLAYDNSLNANIVSDIKTGEIALANNAACKLLGYPEMELKTKNLRDVFVSKEGDFMERLRTIGCDRQCKILLVAKRKSGESFPCEFISVVFTGEDLGGWAINTIVDLSLDILFHSDIIAKNEKINDFSNTAHLQEIRNLVKCKNEKQIQQNDKFLIASKLSFDGIWDWNLLTNDCFLGKGFEELFGNDIKIKKGNIFSDWTNYLHPDDKDAVLKGLNDSIASCSSEWEHTYRFIKADGSVSNVYGRASIIRDDKGKAIRMIGVIHDISKQKFLEERLKQEVVKRKNLHKEYDENFNYNYSF